MLLTRRTASAAAAAGAIALIIATAACGAPTPNTRPAGLTCPATGHAATNTWTQTRTTLLPAGARHLGLCRYTPAHGGGLTLRGRHTVATTTAITKLTKDINALPRIPHSSTPTACPQDTGEIVILLASYPHHRATVTAQLSGCRTLSNGHRALNASALGHQALLDPLRRLTT